MTDCETLEARLVDLCEGAVDDAERAGLEQHLSDCPSCRTALEETRALREAYAALPQDDVSPGLAANVLDAAREAVATERPAPSSRTSPLRWPLAAAAALLLVWALVQTFGDAAPSNREADWISQGSQLEQAGDLEGAEAHYRRALQQSGEDAAAQRHRLADLLMDTGRWEEAVEEFSLILEAHPGYRERQTVHVALARTLVDLGRLDEALSSYRQIAEGPAPGRHIAEQELQALESLILTDQQREALQSLGYIR